MKANNSSPITYNEACVLLGLQGGRKYSSTEIDVAYKQELATWSYKRSTAHTEAALSRAVGTLCLLQDAKQVLSSAAPAQNRNRRPAPKAQPAFPSYTSAPGPVVPDNNSPVFLKTAKRLATIFKTLAADLMSIADYLKNSGVPWWVIVTTFATVALLLVHGCTLLFNIRN